MESAVSGSKRRKLPTKKTKNICNLIKNQVKNKKSDALKMYNCSRLRKGRGHSSNMDIFSSYGICHSYKTFMNRFRSKKGDDELRLFELLGSDKQQLFFKIPAKVCTPSFFYKCKTTSRCP